MKLLSDRVDKAIALWESNNNKKFVAADLARACGFERAAVGGWKTGRTKAISSDHLFCVAKYFGVDPIWLSTGKGSISIERKQVKTTVDRQILAKAVQLVELVIKKNSLNISEKNKADVMAMIYSEIIGGEEVADREISLLLRSVNLE